MKKKRIFLTGGSGFIGTHLIELLKDEYEITVFDIHPTPHNVKFIQGDVGDVKKITEAMSGHNIVIHLAASVGVKVTEEEPIRTLNTNLLGTKNLLDSCAANDIEKIIFSSSSEVYGEPIRIPIDEAQLPVPVTTYGVSKLAAEEYVRVFSEKFGFKYTILRFFNAVGTNQAESFVLTEFINNAIKNTPIIIHGTGLQIRAFCDIKDICQGIIASITKGDNEIINIGNDVEPISIENLAKKVIMILDSKSTVKFIPFEQSGRNRSVEILSRIPNIKKAKKLLSYEPKYNLEHSITTISKNI